jgi:hypothetical protein
MALITGLVGLLARFAGRVLNTTLGWATILLFGKVAQNRQTMLLVIVLASLAWVAAVLGILLPDLGAILIAAVPAPDFIDDGSIRLVMLGAAIVLPLLIGAAALYVAARDRRASGSRLVSEVIRGYPFALVLALTIVALAGVATWRKLRSLSRRWEDAHIPIVVQQGGYDELVGQLQCVLDEAGLAVQPEPASPAVSMPPRLLNAIAGRALGELVPDRLMLLRSPDLEVLVYPSDLALSGRRAQVALARAVVSANLARAPAYLTMSAEAQAVEDDIDRVALAAPYTGPAEQLDAIRRLDRRLAQLTVPFEEWETLYRQRLQLERDVLVARDGEPAPAPPVRGAPPVRELAIAAIGFALVALDLLLLLRSRRNHRR